ncbi:Methyltransferase [Mizuhopecten yessoensis]|uniref:Methyltransferase n=1 Tax=Mizuhopecten yessoensis TaxID=6573 RepID=A0A210R4J1_MIZYE|nr:Methyltransferase [Mizuhopecten yessoensis]
MKNLHLKVPGVKVDRSQGEVESKKFIMNPTYRRFEDKEHVTGYAKYQPSYPKELYDKTKNVLPAIGRKHASSGQRTFPLTKICKHVIWIDVSREQISKARKAASNIDYRVGQAKDLSFLGDGTIDFMAVATAIHWMDIPICIREVSRVLRPGGVVAVYSFGPDTIHNKEAHQLVWEVYKHYIVL